MQEIKLIAIDLDGTLLSSEKTISEANLTALRAAVARGVYVVLASGRSYSNAMDFSEAIAKGQPLICANGAMATLSDPYECVYCECLSKDKLRAAVEILEREKCYYNVYCDDGAVMESRTSSAGRKREANGYAVYRGTVLSGDEMPKYVGDGALKVVCFSPDREKMQRIRSAAERISGVEINSSWWDNIEIMAAGVHKGAALRCLAQRLEIPLDEVMAIGDNENDLPMLKAAGLPVAMGNAVERVKEQCAYVTATNDEDGVARAVRRFVLHEEQ